MAKTPNINDKEVDVIENQEYTLTQLVNSMTNTTSEAEYNLGTATITNVGTPLVRAEDDSANTRTKFIANSKCVVHITFSSNANANANVCATKNGIIEYVGSGVGAGDIGQVSANIELEAEEYFTIGSCGTGFSFTGSTLFAGGSTRFSFTATAITKTRIGSIV